MLLIQSTTTSYVSVAIKRAEEIVRQHNLVWRLLAPNAPILSRDHQEVWGQFQASGAYLKKNQAKLLRMQKALAEGPVAETFREFFEEELRDLEKNAEEALEVGELLTSVLGL